MAPLFRRMLSIIAALILVLVFIILASPPISGEHPTLTFSSTDMAPGIIYTGDNHSDDMQEILMLKIKVEVSNSDHVTINSLTFHRAGLASDADVENIKLYKDTNLNGTFDGNDELLSTTQFLLGKAKFSVPFNVTRSNPAVLFIVIDISNQSQTYGTLGVDIPDKHYIRCEQYSIIEFDFPISSKNSTFALDTDGDYNPDITDYDDDNDGYTDDFELRCKSDFKDASILPEDTDSDYVPDEIDSDDDNDGVPDKYDDYPKDKSRQRDYTIVIIYAVLAAILTIILLHIGWGTKTKGSERGNFKENNKFDMIGKEEDLEGIEELIEEDDEDLLGEN